MKDRGRNATAERPPDEGASDWRRPALLAVLALAVPLAAARAEAPRLPPAARSRGRDLELTVHARRALQGYVSLGQVGVFVTDGVATIWGAVPTADDGRRAVKLLEAVPGIASVRSELRLEKGKPTRLLALPVPEDPPTRSDAASPDPVSGSLGTLTRRNPAHFPPPPAPPPPAVALMPPVATAPAPPRAAPAPPSPAEAVEALRNGDRRFRRIRAEVSGGTVSLHPVDTPQEHVMAFYQLLARVPGVERVVIKNDGR
jgi:BON domain-containing protein